jgi:hypothetical protein
MSGQRISAAQRRIIKSNRSFVKNIREGEFKTFGNNAESNRVVRAFARVGK